MNCLFVLHQPILESDSEFQTVVQLDNIASQPTTAIGNQIDLVLTRIEISEFNRNWKIEFVSWIGYFRELLLGDVKTTKRLRCEHVNLKCVNRKRAASMTVSTFLTVTVQLRK